MSSGWGKVFSELGVGSWELGVGSWGRKRLFCFRSSLPPPPLLLLSPFSVECFRFWLIYTFVGVGTKVVALSLGEVLG
jgi:hypothetical protein